MTLDARVSLCHSQATCLLLPLLSLEPEVALGVEVQPRGRETWEAVRVQWPGLSSRLLWVAAGCEQLPGSRAMGKAAGHPVCCLAKTTSSGSLGDTGLCPCPRCAMHLQCADYLQCADG